MNPDQTAGPIDLPPGHVHIWKIRLDRRPRLVPTAEESAHATRLATTALRRRYLAAHSAVRDILSYYTSASLDFARHPRGKPYLSNTPELRFNLTHSCSLALLAIARDLEVGIDLERLRPLPDYPAIAQRYFPEDVPSPTSVRDFFRQWTRFEALLKAHGAGLFAIGEPPPGDWCVRTLDAGPRCAAALASQYEPRAIEFHEYPHKENE